MHIDLRLITLSSILLLAADGFSQMEYEQFRADTSLPLVRRGNFFALSFDKAPATYQWNGVAQLDQTAKPFSIVLDERFRSTIIQSGRQLIRDEQSLGFRVQHQWIDRLAGVFEANNFVLSDDQRFSDGQRPSVTSASSNSAYGGFQAQPFEGVFVEPLVGIRYDNQVGVRDNGASYILGLWSDALEIGGYQTTFAGRLQRDVLTPRLLKRDSLTIGIGKTFVERTRDSLQFYYSSNQRDFYFSADTATIQEFNAQYNIERRLENTIGISNLLEYNIGTQALLTLQGNISSRTIDRTFQYRPIVNPVSQTLVNTTVDEFRIGGIARLAFRPAGNVATTLLFLINERDEKHSVEPDDRIPGVIDDRVGDETKKDNLSRRTMLGATIDLVLSESDVVLLSGSTSLLRYDTPSSQNVEDRDELWYSMNLTTLHQINSHLHFRFLADVNLNHLVYILKDRSANNTWNRVFRLAPRLSYVPSRDFSTANTFEVLANYTVYDFEDILSVQVKSSSFRQFAWIDSTRWAFTSRCAAVGYAHIRLYQRGELRWDVFKERPANYFEDKTFLGRIEYSLEERLLFSVGVRYFSQIRFGYASGSRVFESVLKSIGPLAMIRWQFGEHSSVALEGWHERQTLTGSAPGGFTTMTISLNVYL